MRNKLIKSIIIMLFGLTHIFATRPYRVGTTTANFLEIGIGARAMALGDAYVTESSDLSSQYWNPAGLAFLDNNSAMISHQPWIAGINMSYAGAGILVPNIGTIAFGITNFDYGSEDVTTLAMQEGTGEQYTASEHCFSLSYSRKLAQWFSFGANGKMVVSNIWHMTGYAAVVDLGVLVKTNFLSVTGKRKNGLKIGMSISNYGTSMKYSGKDIMTTVDLSEKENGNYEYIPAEYKLKSWDLPIIFRVGLSATPIKTRLQQLKIYTDAIHPNNNSESINLGTEYKIHFPGAGSFALRGGYKGLFMVNSEFGPTFGMGIVLHLFKNSNIKFDYSYSNIGVFDNISSYCISYSF